MYWVSLINKDGCYFDSAKIGSRRDVRSWATGRGGDYICVLYNKDGEPMETWRYKGGRKVKGVML